MHHLFEGFSGKRALGFLLKSELCRKHSDLDKNNFIALPVLYTRTEKPITKANIPTREDVDLWPHLGRVYLPNVSAEIGLLIPSDVPEALDPLEVKISEHGGP